MQEEEEESSMISTPSHKGGGKSAVEGGFTGIKGYKGEGGQSRVVAERIEYEKEFREIAEVYKEALK